ncbi:MAG TPA: LamG-like jellyroll fold domain-containing protein [Mycobacteriales bacterium]|jgi:hypothetical protein
MRFSRFLVLPAMVAVVIPLGGVPLNAPAALAAPGGDSPATPSTAPDEAAAMRAARAGGTRVEVAQMRSETQQVFANPDGTFTLTQSLEPVRVHRPDGSWVPVDTALHTRPDGTVAPGAVSVDVAFSGGGTGPLVSITRGGKSLTLGWPTTLPKPILDGSTATYPDVLPGADLRLQASARGFSEQLVIRTRTAAVNPALARLRFSLGTAGLAVRQNKAGGLEAVDSAGGVVFSAPAPIMWDTPVPAAELAAPAGARADDGIPGAHRARLGVALGKNSLSLTPDRSILTDPDTVFPVVVDPSFTYGSPSWTEVNAEDPNSATWRSVPTSLAVGYQDFESPWSRVRSFVHYPLDSRIYSTHILSATFNTFETWSSSCTPTAVELWVTGGFSGSTTWNNQPTWGSHLSNQIVAKGHDSSCAAGAVQFVATSGVAGAAKNHSSITFGLKAGNETDHLSWKKFQVNPTLTVVYNRPPATPTAATMSTSNPNSSCSNSITAAPHVKVLVDKGITLQVKATDPDGDDVRVEIDFWDDASGTSLALATSPAFASGTTIKINVLKSPELTNGAVYKWRAKTMDVGTNGLVVDQSGTSAWCYVVQDSTSPNEPVVTSTDYPTDAYAGGAGQTGVFSISPGSTSDTDLSGYLYGVDQPEPGTFVAADVDGNANPSVAPPSYGPHDLFVQAKDTAGNLSSVISYHFYADSPTDASAYWRLDEGSGSTVVGTIESDPGNNGGPSATLSPTGVTWNSVGKVGDALNFDGATGSVSASTARINTSQSFTVTAWVRLTSTADFATAVSQDGTRMSGFYLQYNLATNRWALAMQSADSDTIVSRGALSSQPPQLNTWTHLAGVFDAATQQMRLYVNGTAQGTTSNTTPWDAPGQLQIGRALSRGELSNYWPGDIDEVRVYQRALTGGEIGDIINHDNAAAPAGAWNLDETTGSSAADSSGNGHPATLTTGASFTTAGHTNGGLALDGVTGAATTASPVVRTDQSFTIAAWVYLSDATKASTIASQDGTNASGFILQFQPTSDGFGQWVFALTPDDTAGTSAVDQAVIPAFDSVGAWVHLAGVYDAFRHTLELRVTDSFGPVVAYGTQPTPWYAGSGFLVGRDLTVDDNGAVVPGDFLAGTVDEVRLYAGTLTESDLRVLAGQ